MLKVLERTLLPAALAVFCLSFLSVPAFAQDWRTESAYRQEGARYAYDYGYRRGMDQGRDDGKDGRAFDYARAKDYRNADKGYKGRYGDRDWYRGEFRRGYVDGYTRGYNQFAPRGGGYGGYIYYDNRGVYGGVYRNDGDYDRDDRYDGGGQYYGNEPYYQGQAYSRGRLGVGYDRGYNDGLQKGAEDARKARSYQPDRHGWYRSADHGYHREYGPRDDYAVSYRDGFIAGYREAYQGRYYR